MRENSASAAPSWSTHRLTAQRLRLLRQVGSDPGEQALEYELSARNLVYWTQRYAWTYDPREAASSLPFFLFPRQREFLGWLRMRENLREDGLAEKSRDVGFTWLCCAYATHRWLFRPGFKCGFGSRKLDLVDRIGDPDSIFERMRFLLRNLPRWMLPRGFAFGKHDGYCRILNPANGASITGEGGDNIGRGGRSTIYFIDEAAYLLRPRLIEASLSATTRCRIWVSTPNGPGNPFYTKRFSGTVPVFTFHWKDDPRKDDAWYEREKARLCDPVIVAQELDIDYSASLEGVCIPARWVRASVELELEGFGGSRASREIPPAAGEYPIVAGFDVAEEGRSRSVLIARRGPLVLEPVSWGQVTTSQGGWRAADEAERLGVKLVFFDAIGVGAGIKGLWTDSERKLGFTSEAIKWGGSASNRRWSSGKTAQETFRNLRTELWWTLRDRFEKTYEYIELGVPHPADILISLPNHPQLIAELSLPLYFHTAEGKVALEGKPEMRRRGVASPDFADALALSFAPQKISAKNL